MWTCFRWVVGCHHNGLDYINEGGNYSSFPKSLTNLVSREYFLQKHCIYKSLFMICQLGRMHHSSQGNKLLWKNVSKDTRTSFIKITLESLLLTLSRNLVLWLTHYATGLFYTPWKRKKLLVFWCFQGYGKRPLGWSELVRILETALAQEYFKFGSSRFFSALNKRKPDADFPRALKESYCENFGMHSIHYICFPENIC